MDEIKDIKPVLAKLQIEELNPMQEAALRAIGGRKDVVLLSPTGSGKTLAYLLPVLRRLKSDVRGVQAIVIVPSRELAMQIDAVFKSMGTAYLSMSCYGGHSTMEEKRSLIARQPSLIIGTPGRLNDHLGKGNFSVENVHTFILDEFDKSLELGFQDEMAEVLSYIDGVEKRILTSATDLENIPDFVEMGRTTRLDFLKEDGVEERLHMMRVDSPTKDKIDTLYQLLCTLGSNSTIVFCNYRESVDRVVTLLKEKQFYCEGFHGGMEQENREKAIYKFRSGSCHVLVSTDLAARGLDIPEIQNIIHYHLPVSEDAFTHRNGRTARWESKGNAFVILHSEENIPVYFPSDLENCVLPEEQLKPTKPLWATLYIGKGKKDKLNKIDIVGFLYKKCQLTNNDVGQIDVRDRYALVAVKRKKIKQTLNLAKSEKIKGKKTIIEEAK